MNPQTLLELIFGVIIVGFLVVDLGYFNRKPHKVSTKSAVIQSLFWLTVSLAYGGLIFALLGHVPAVEFTSAYFTEKMLSVDNLFVMLLIFRYFKLDEKYHHKVLFWGILGAVIFRGIFIGAGSVLIEHFHWLLYIFGVILCYSGIKLFLGNDDDSVDIEKNRVLKFSKRYLPILPTDGEGSFIVKLLDKRYLSLMFLVLILIETTDIVFAFDSIPAVFAITQNPFIVFTSNIFAIMGLRALYFLVENIMSKFHYLQKGLSFILVFIGGKMLAEIFGLHISPVVSLIVVLGTLISSALLSIAFPKK